jgi:hypothetical protein
MPAPPKSYYRTLPTLYPRNTDPLPTHLTPQQITTQYPNHLENRLIVAKLTSSGLTPTQIYSLLPSAIKQLSTSAGWSAKADISRLNAKVYDERNSRVMREDGDDIPEGMTPDTLHGYGKAQAPRVAVRETGPRDDETGAPVAMLRNTLNGPAVVQMQPSWVNIGVGDTTDDDAELPCDHPALSEAATYRHGLSGSVSGCGKMYQGLPDKVVELLAEGVVLGAKIEHFTAMARVVRWEMGKLEKENEEGEEE